VLDAVPAEVLFRDAGGVYRYCNRGFARAQGREPGEILGRRFEEVMPLETVARHSSRERELTEDGAGEIVYESEERSAGEGLRILQFHRTRFPDPAGRGLGILGVGFDVTERKRVEEGLRRREAILKAVGFASRRLLSAPRWREGVEAVLAALGEAARAERCYIFENRSGVDGGLRARHRYEWVAPGVESQIEREDLQDLDLEAPVLRRLRERFERGLPLVSPIAALLPEERPLFESLGLRSVALFPIATPEGWWGLLGFDDCADEGSWSAGEAEALGAAADLLAAAIRRERADRDLRESEQRYRQLFEESPDLVFVLAENGRVLDASRRTCEVLGYLREEILEMRFDGVIEGGAGHPVQAERWRRIRNVGYDQFESTLRNRAGEERSYEVRASFTQHSGFPAILAIARDITERKRYEERISRLAYRDALTGLANRVAFLLALEAAVEGRERSSSRFALLFLDLDGFKEVNDSLGHEAGDRVLSAVARRVERSVRERDLVARMGGDEFTVLLADLPRPEDGETVARHLLRRIGEPYDLDGVSVRVGASIGVAVFPEDGRDVDELLSRADTAMYRAKRAGRGRVARWSPEEGAEDRDRSGGGAGGSEAKDAGGERT